MAEGQSRSSPIPRPWQKHHESDSSADVRAVRGTSRQRRRAARSAAGTGLEASVSPSCGLRDGHIVLEDACGSGRELRHADSGPAVRVCVHRSCVLSALSPRAAASARARPTWRAAGVATTWWRLVRMLVRNRDVLDGMETRPRPARRLGAARLALPCAAIPAAGSRRNIAAHYDLGNDFFALFLSADLMYSSALWDGRTTTRSSRLGAQARAICRKLQTCARSDHVLEIGTGWGGFALHAAAALRLPRDHHHDLARAVCAGAASASRRGGPGGSRHVLLAGLSRSDGQYDKLVSIEMIEAVGARLPGHLFRAARPAAQARGPGADPGHHHRGSSLRAGAASRWISSSATCSPAASFPRSQAMLRGQDPRQRPGAGRAGGLRPLVRAHAGRLARAIPARSCRRCARWASTSGSSACGNSTSPIAKGASASAPSAWRTCCSGEARATVRLMRAVRCGGRMRLAHYWAGLAPPRS